MKSYTMLHDKKSGEYIVKEWQEHFIFGTIPTEIKGFLTSSEAQRYMTEKMNEQLRQK